MAQQDNLKKIAQEFVMFDEICSRMRRKEKQPYESVQGTYQVWRGYTAPKTIDSTQAAKKYGGVLVVEGRRKYRA